MGCCESRHKNIKKNMEKTSIITKKNENKKINIQNPNIENPIKQTEKKVIARNIDYNQLKTIKTLKNTHDSKIYLLQYSIVKKVYPHNLDGVGQFQNEVAAYRYLEKCDFTTRLLYHNRNELAIYLPYLRDRPEKNNQNILLLNALLRELDEKWNVKRLKKYHWDNVREHNGKMYLIDFGAIPFVYSNESNKKRWLIKTK